MNFKQAKRQLKRASATVATLEVVFLGIDLFRQRGVVTEPEQLQELETGIAQLESQLASAKRVFKGLRAESKQRAA